MLQIEVEEIRKTISETSGAPLGGSSFHVLLLNRGHMKRILAMVRKRKWTKAPIAFVGSYD